MTLAQSKVNVSKGKREGDTYGYNELMRQMEEEGIVGVDTSGLTASVVTKQRKYDQGFLLDEPFIWELLTLDCVLRTKGSKIFHAEFYLYRGSQCWTDASQTFWFFVVVHGEVVMDQVRLRSHEGKNPVDYLKEKGIFSQTFPFSDDEKEANFGDVAWSVARMRMMYGRFYETTEVGRIGALVLGNLRLDHKSFWLAPVPVQFPLTPKSPPSMRAMLGTLTTISGWLLFFTITSIALRIFWR